MEEPSSSSPVTQLDDRDLQEGYTTSGKKVTQETTHRSEKGQLVVQPTDSPSFHPPNHPRKSDHLEKDSVQVTTKCTAISKEGHQRLPPEENSFEEPKDGSIKDSHVGSHKDLPKVEPIPNNDVNDEDFQEPTFCPRDKKSDGLQQHTCMQCPNISRGDLIAIPKLWGLYYHDMIYIGDGDVVHRTGGIRDWLHFKKVRIKREKLADIIPYNRMPTLVIENGSWQGHDPLPTDEILCRANSKIGEKGYNLYSKNCEHFARWCRYRQEVSEQANNLLSKQQAVKAVLFSWASNQPLDHRYGFPFLHVRGHAEIL
ncbi:uncharacterized protein LOC116301357 [Actinia tenebrosa]|uniref:Uncharacterized protein LOC116301357 n=1 Tax=Actinia tenebrosa TaxID=6105 RepID=A0A6P8IHF6_ACTTE|nr:uncharacterized protein LOC116301357 [Actinia tenebrosa]